MDDLLPEEALESLETFISLKQQKSIIFAWMEIKKMFRKSIQGSHQSRSKSVRSHSIYSTSREIDYIKESARREHSRNSGSRPNQILMQYSRPAANKLSTVQAGPAQGGNLYNTFGKMMPTSMKSSKNVTIQTPKQEGQARQ